MRDSVHLTIDVGTSSIKGGLFSNDGTMLQYFHEHLPSQNLSPDSWYAGLSSVLSQISSKYELVSICISGNGPTIIPSYRDGSWGDIIYWYEQKKNSRIEGTKSFFLPKIRWFFENSKDSQQNLESFQTCPGFFTRLLTGEKVATAPSREFSESYWSQEDIEAYELDSALLPNINFSGDLCGYTCKTAAEKFGIETGIPVFGGGSDFLMSLLGTGTVKPGRACDRAGTSEGINYCSPIKINSPYLRTLPHVIEGRYNIAGILASTGRVFEWFRDLTGQRDSSYIDMMNEIKAMSVNEASPFFFPSSLHDATWEFDAGMFADLQPHHTRVHLGRGVVEAIGFGIKEVLGELSRNDCRVSELRGSGGQMRNPVWTRMKSDILGLPILVPEVIDAELLGCLICSMKGLGHYSSIEDAAENLVKIKSIFEPDPEMTLVYQDRYDEYLAKREGLIETDR